MILADHWMSFVLGFEFSILKKKKVPARFLDKFCYTQRFERYHSASLEHVIMHV